MLKMFKIVAILEGLSYLAFGITMPLKYKLDMPEPNYVVGMLHGVLFIAYILIAFLYAQKKNWNIKKTALVLLASVIPFATFIVERKILANED